jgi:hypothetical protein
VHGGLFVFQSQKPGDDVAIGAAVQRAFERSDAGDDGGIDIGERGGGDARGEGGGVEFVVGVQDECHVEGVLHYVVGSLAGQSVEEVRGEAEVRVVIDGRQVFAQAVVGGRDGGGLRHQPYTLAPIGFDRRVRLFRVEHAEHGNGGAQHVHGIGGGGDDLQEIDHARGQRTSSHQVASEVIELRLFGQPAIPKKKDDFFENRIFGQGMDVVAAVAEDALKSVDVAEFAFAGDYAFQSTRSCSHVLSRWVVFR